MKISQTDDHEAILTTDHIIIIITIDPLIIPRIEITFIKTNQEIILSHHIKKSLNVQTSKIKTIEFVHRNIKDN